VPTRVRFRGYRLVDRYPEFHYEVEGLHVYELIRAPHHGSGIERRFRVQEVKAPVFFVAELDAGATFASSAGRFSGGVLPLSAYEARDFTITMTEAPGREPLGYWSMNDVLTVKKPTPVEGVKGRAVRFDGKKAQHDTGLKTDALAQGGTIALWVKLAKPTAREQVFVGGKSEAGEFALAHHPGGVGFAFVAGSARAETNQPASEAWHHLAATVSPNGLALFVDGRASGTATGGALPRDTAIFLGSQGGAKFAAATLDETRIYDRVLSEEEIRGLAADRTAK
jgi:hypothetical protein